MAELPSDALKYQFLEGDAPGFTASGRERDCPQQPLNPD